MDDLESIVYIEDDEDDQVLIQAAIRDLGLGYKIVFFSQAEQALTYLQDCVEKPVMILCDVNLPGMKGLELRKLIDADEQLRQKSIPFIFFSTEAGDQQINQAYESPIQGFFLKATSFSAIKEQLQMILRYWNACLRPKPELNGSNGS